DQDRFVATRSMSFFICEDISQEIGRLDVAPLPAQIRMADRPDSAFAQPCSWGIVVSSNDNELRGRNGGIGESVHPRRDAARDLDVNGSLLNRALGDRALDAPEQAIQVVRGEFQLPQATAQASQVLRLEPAAAAVHAEDFVDRVAEKEAAVPNRHARLI